MDASTDKRSVRERHAETVRAARAEGAKETGQIGSSATLVRLASKLDVPVTDLAIRMSSDTVRKTKYPVVEEAQADGTTVYRHPIEIIEGPRSR